MERLLSKLANQLMACDEASIMSLWNTYALKVQEFEPTKEWEEASLIFCMIQAIVFKNQLFNYNLANEYSPLDNADMPQFFPGGQHGAHGQQTDSSGTSPGNSQPQKKKATLLRFPKQEE